MFGKILCLLVSLAASACNLVMPNDQLKKAEEAAELFFDNLSTGRYAETDALFAGDYAQLASLTILVTADNHAGLWKNACENSGMQCLPIRRIIKTEKFSLNEFWLVVEFLDRSGGPLTQDPCCGANADASPPVSQFDVYVIERDGRYLVTSLPVFLP